VPDYIETTPIVASKLLVVEGKDDQLFFESLLKDINKTDIQVLPYGGKTKLRSYLTALSINEAFITKVNTLVVIRDADSNATSTFQSACSALTNAGLNVPAAPLTLTNSPVKTGIIILPPNDNQGKLEDICLKSVRDDKATTCVDGYFNCLQELTSFTMPKDISKAKVHAFLASRYKADLRLGEAAQAGYWPLNHIAFNPIRSFLSTL
jgi:hypothetical protein